MLASELATNPRNMLQRLVEIAADLCTADTAGLSLLDGDVFRWEAVTGTSPLRRAAPCLAPRARAASASTATRRS